jgi:competence protein ComFC
MKWLWKLIFPLSAEQERIRKYEYKDLLPFYKRRVISDCPVTVVLFPYRTSIIRTMIWELKYKKNKRVAELFAAFLSKELLAEERVVLIPLPLSKKRMRERGYNQCELVAQAVTALNVHLCTNLLQKTKDTARQSHSTKRARHTNLKGAFAIRTHTYPREANIILLDDVYTTGSTVCEAYTTLVRAGYTNVRAIILAH